MISNLRVSQFKNYPPSSSKKNMKDQAHKPQDGIAKQCFLKNKV